MPVPQLTLDPAAPAAPAPEAAKPEATPVRLDENLLNDAEKQAVEAFSKKIDLTDSNLILQYGAAAQKNVASFSENALNSVRTKDLGEVGKSLSELVVELKGFGEEGGEEGDLRTLQKDRAASWRPRRPSTPRWSPTWTRSPGSWTASGHAFEGCGHVRPDV